MPATIHTVATRIADGVVANCRKSPERMAWLEGLPAVVQELEHRWELTPDALTGGDEPSCSYVQAVRRSDGRPAVLKISMPHMEQECEIDGLRFWNGDPTVRLLESDDELRAMLLERCQPGTTLRVLDECEQDIVISGLLRRLWRPLPTLHRFRALSAMIEHWSNETLAQVERWPDGGLVREGLRVLKELSYTASRDVLLATDLHAGNVLRSERKSWLVIDPKPFVGDPAYDGTQHLFNCSARLQCHPHRTMRRLADLLGVDYERLRSWTFGRAAAEPREDWSNRQWTDLARAIAP
ncbi:MAG: hydroxyurea phosphotransferase [Acidobacteria bacterium]|nr:hydroxyurea phosphotransferase [Acidobacteriota bacterium]